ncbi:hypothetical protein BIWAKO_04805 [Bosea sp. BIWAKO-01]|nr:hypothetical protein BIWAKO_04805 [Bosea sp. BIWAKO-01]
MPRRFAHLLEQLSDRVAPHRSSPGDLTDRAIETAQDASVASL